MMKLLLSEYAGFCFGVDKAVKTSFDLNYDGNKYTMGELIHNRNVIEQLEKSGLSKKEFAEKINISPSMVTKWTTTSSMPKLEYIEKICQILNTNVEYIITGKGTDESHELQLDKKLKKDEKELIKKYRKLSRKEKSKMIAIANYFINSYRTETENERGDCIG